MVHLLLRVSHPPHLVSKLLKMCDRQTDGWTDTSSCRVASHSLVLNTHAILTDATASTVPSCSKSEIAHAEIQIDDVKSLALVSDVPRRIDALRRSARKTPTQPKPPTHHDRDIKFAVPESRPIPSTCPCLKSTSGFRRRVQHPNFVVPNSVPNSSELYPDSDSRNVKRLKRYILFTLKKL